MTNPHISSLVFPKNRLIRAASVLFTLSLFSFITPPDEPLKKEQILGLMRLTTDWQLAHLPAVAITSAGNAEKLPITGWVRATFQTGLVAAYEATGEQRYLDTLLAWSERSGWELGPRSAHADDHCVGQTYAALFRLRPDSARIKPLMRSFDAVLANPQPGPVAGWSKNKNWSWCDALFMAPPVWATLGQLTGNRRYVDFMNDRWWETYELLYDKKEHLYYRDTNFVWTAGGQPPADPTMVTRKGGKILWSRGNGWVLAGLARTLDAMPANYPARPRYEQLFREMAKKIASVQHPDGLWRTNLVDAGDFPTTETSGSAFFCYGLAWGIRNGLLPEVEYGPVVQRAWQGLSRSVTKDGKLGYAQRVGHRPVDVSPDDTMEYATGALLLAGRELLRTSLR